MKTIFCLIITFFSFSLKGQNCYQTFLNEGIKSFETFDFEKAINQFRAARICDDLPSNNQIEDWIDKAQNGYILAIKKEQVKARSLGLTARSILELQKKNNASKAFRYAQHAIGLDDTKEARAALYESFYQLENIKRKIFYIRDIEVFQGLDNAIRNAGFIDHGQSFFVMSEYDSELLLYDFQGNEIAKKSIETHNYSEHAYSEKTGLLLTTEKTGGRHYVVGFYLKNSKISETPVFKYPSLEGDIKTLAVSKDGEFVVAAFNNGEVHILNGKGEFLYQLEKEESAIIDAAFSNDHHVALVSDKFIKVVHLEKTGSTVIMNRKERGLFNSKVTISPYNKYVMAAYSRQATVWDVEGDSILASLSTLNTQKDIGDFSYDEKYVTFGYQVLNLESKKQVNKFDEEIRNMKFSPDRKYLLANAYGATPRIWRDRENFREVDYDVLGGHKSVIRSIQFSPDSTHVLSASEDQTLKIWNTKMGAATKLWSVGKAYQDFKLGNESIIAFVKEGDDGKRNVVNLFNGRGEHVSYSKLPVDEILAVSADSKYLYANVEDGFEIWSQDFETNRLDFKMGYRGVDIASFADFSTNGKVVFFTNQNLSYSLQIWDLEANTLNYLSGYEDILSSVKWSEDNKHIIALNKYGKVFLWNVEAQPVLVKTWTPHPDYNCNDLDFSKDGQTIITCGGDNTAIVWGLDANPISTLLGHTNKVIAADFSPNGRFIITASLDGTGNLWSTDGELIYTFDTPDYTIRNVRFSNDGQYIITGYSDQSVRIWPFDPILIFKYLESYNIPDLPEKEKLKYGIVD